MKSRTLMDFDKSFNMIIGTTTSKQSFDWFHNPYIVPRVYEVTEEWKPKISEDIQLRPCIPSKDMQFIKESIRTYYPNSICFDKNIHLRSNWYDDSYQNFYISFDACQNATSGAPHCKSEEEIENFLNTNIFYTIT